MQHIAEGVISLRRKKPIVGVDDPFELRRIAALAGDGGIHRRFAAQPLQIVALGLQDSAILLRSARDPFLAVVENVDIAGKARRIHIQGRAARNIAFRVTASRKQAQNVRLNPSERHGGTLPRFARPDVVPANHPRAAGCG